MSEENKGVIREFFKEVGNAGNLDRADELVSPGYVEHQELPGGEGRQDILKPESRPRLLSLTLAERPFIYELRE